jgi:transposase
MDSASIFTAALDLTKPWMVTKTDFNTTSKELHIYIDFPRGSQFACPTCQTPCPIHDTSEKIWRHLDFFQHKAFLHARVPRANCKQHGILLVDLPWTRPHSGFTLLFESLLATLAQSMPVLAITRFVGEHDTRIWRSLDRQVKQARANVDMASVRTIGIDETSVRKHHKYLTIFADIETSRVLFATPGKGSDTLVPFLRDLTDHGGSARRIREVSIDMSPAFIRGVEDHIPHAKITFDKFHVTKLVMDALEQVRRSEQKESPEHYELLKNSRFSLLKNPENMSDRMMGKLNEIRFSELNLKTARAWRLKQAFRSAYGLAGKIGEAGLRKWCSWANRCRLEPMRHVAKTIQKNWEGVIGYFKSRVTNAVMESINAGFQAARAKARGYRNPHYATIILYLTSGGLQIPTLNKFHTK